MVDYSKLRYVGIDNGPLGVSDFTDDSVLMFERVNTNRDYSNSRRESERIVRITAGAFNKQYEMLGREIVSYGDHWRDKMDDLLKILSQHEAMDKVAEEIDFKRKFGFN